MPPLPAAVLWDMDGTLIDSEPYWMAAETELVESHGGTWTEEQALQMVGNSLPTSAKILQQAGVDLTEAAIIDFLLERVVAQVKAHTPWLAGARELLSALVAAQVPCALVTASYRQFAEIVVERSGGALQVVVTGDEVTHGKPHPEPYLTAAARLGVPAERCVAIEDSDTGIASAMAAGARVLGVESHVPLPASPLLSTASSLARVDLEALSRIAAGEVLHLASGASTKVQA
ncbi:MAG: HAD family phosphatase [Promicromonosporaceae bacterium]|nr:HAD family phosphatase [Promicromonosporaceae bacterium]